MDLFSVPLVKFKRPEDWRLLPLSKIVELMGMLPPPPVSLPDGMVATFIPPRAAEDLHKVRELLMEMLAGSMVVTSPAALDLMAQAHDAEECAQKGEPDPWCDWMVREHIEQNGQAAHDEWVAERRAAMLCALKAVGLA